MALTLAGVLLELSGKVEKGDGLITAREILQGGQAYAKFLAICKAQGGFREPEQAPFSRAVCASVEGVVVAINCRLLAKVAKLAGAPVAKTAGLECPIKIGDPVKKGDLLFKIHAESTGELDYALAFVKTLDDIIQIK